MTTVTKPADEVTAARIEYHADRIEAACRQLDCGDIPTPELTASIRADVTALRKAINRDKQNAKAEEVLQQASQKARLEVQK